MCSSDLLLLALCAACAACGASAQEETLDATLRKSVAKLPVGDTGAMTVLRSYRPRGDGPFPWIVLCHDTSPSPESNRAIGRYRNPRLLREWLGRGYAVFVLIRRGYGASGASAWVAVMALARVPIPGARARPPPRIF